MSVMHLAEGVPDCMADCFGKKQNIHQWGLLNDDISEPFRKKLK